MGILLASIDIPILKEIVIIFGLSVVIILAFQKLKIPAIIGFLITGIVAGPHGLGLIHAGEDIEILAEIGVIFLLFVIGIEFSLKSLLAIKRTVFWGGLMQVGLTIGVTALVTLGLGKAWNEAVFVGFLFALSSTAIVLKMLQERGETNAPHGRIAVAILIFQDLIVVPMMLVAPLMPGNAENVWVDLGIMSLKVALVLALDILFARYVVPPARNQPIVAEGEKKHASRAHKLTHPEPSQLMPTIPINPSIPIRSTTTKKASKRLSLEQYQKMMPDGF